MIRKGKRGGSFDCTTCEFLDDYYNIVYEEVAIITHPILYVEIYGKNLGIDSGDISEPKKHWLRCTRCNDTRSVPKGWDIKYE